jgi:hypothetical protein
MPNTQTVTVPAEELLEVLAHVGALQTVLEQLEGGFDSELAMRYSDVWTGLTYWEQPDGDLDHERHPLNVKIESRIRELAGELLVQLADTGDIDAAEVAVRGARLLGDAREIRGRGTTGLWRASHA